MPEHTGLLGSLKRLLSTLAGVVTTRLELLVNEWQEEQLRLVRMLAYALLAVFCLSMGVLLLALFLVVLFWDEHRLAVLGALTLAFFVSGGVLVMMVQSKWRQGSKLFSASLAELARDRRSLGERHE
ncbi:MAG: phage holin family protein [Sideroxydans sp.]|nr:phage holin family protein [Sideroxyarcus sp.]